MAARRRKAWLLLLAGLPIAAMAAAWFLQYRPSLQMSASDAADAVGNLCALLGLPLLVVMVVLGTRFPLVERAFGLDRMMRLHKLLAKAVVSLFLAHALLRTLRFSMQIGEGWQWDFLVSADLAAWPLALGRAALCVLLVASPMALLGGRLVPWRIWKSAHLLLSPAIAAGFVHARFVSDDLRRLRYSVIWYALAAVLAGVFVYRVVYRILRGWRVWHVHAVVPETHDTKTLALCPEDSSGPFLSRRAGQFATLRLKRFISWSEPRPFTISCGPFADDLRFTIKRSGWFSTAVHGLRPGARVLVEGPYGVFCPDFDREPNVVMIAGGVGITPFLSAIRHAHRSAPKAHIVLVWGNKTREDIIAADELEELTKVMWLRVVHVLSQEEAEAGAATEAVSWETGLVTADLLKRHVEPEGASWYLCGPPKMQKFVLAQLRAAFGIRPSRVRRELFAW